MEVGVISFIEFEGKPEDDAAEDERLLEAHVVKLTHVLEHTKASSIRDAQQKKSSQSHYQRNGVYYRCKLYQQIIIIVATDKECMREQTFCDYILKRGVSNAPGK